MGHVRTDEGGFYSSNPSIKYKEFRQAARKFRPSVFLPELARLAITMGVPPYKSKEIVKTPPWGIAAAAKESILRGNEHRQPTISRQDVEKIVSLISLEFHQKIPDSGLTGLLAQPMYEQFPFQERIADEIARSKVLFSDAMSDGLDLEVLSEKAFKELLGTSIEAMIGSTFILFTGAFNGEGYFDDRWLDTREAEPLLALWSKEEILTTLDNVTATFEEFKKDFESAPKPDPAFERYGYNPLFKTPFVVMPDGRKLAPQPHLILRTVSPLNMYYRGIKKWETAFSRDLGKLVEHYAGKQLRLFDGANVIGEIIYRNKNQERKSVDWLVLTPQLTLLVEVKSARFNALSKAGHSEIEEQMNRKIGHAIKQINKTHELIQSNHPDFQIIPKDNPIQGLIVTAEPFYQGNSKHVRQKLEPTQIPTTVCSLQGLEYLTALPSSSAADALIRLATDPEHYNSEFMEALSAVIDPDIARELANPIIENAWDSMVSINR